MLKRTRAALLVAAAVLASVVGVAAPAQADGVYCESTGTVSVCYTALSSPPSDPSPNPDSNGWTRGAPTCFLLGSKNNFEVEGIPADQMYVHSTSGGLTTWYRTIDCGGGQSYWSNTRQCYVSMAEGVWPAKPAGYDEEAGYYDCNSYTLTGSGGVGVGNRPFWSNTVPPGLTVYTPGRAAAELIAGFPLTAIEIGMAPQVNPAWGHRRSYVGIPVWLWVNNPQPVTWGPYSETATLGGQTITATAQVSSIRWSMGDGGERVCGSTGTPYSTGYGVSDSPTCGYRYSSTSERAGGDRYTVTATSQWVVTWTSLSGASGVVNTTVASNVQLEVNELQTVNVTPNG